MKKRNAQSAKKRVSSFKDLRARTKNMEPPKKFWGGIPMGTVGFVVGFAKSGKTIVCENLALSIAAGKNEFLGKPIEQTNKRVLFLSMEEDVNMKMILRGNNQIKGFSSAKIQKRINENLFYSDKDFIRSINSKNDWKIIKDEIYKVKPELVIIDSVNRINKEIEKREYANMVMQKFREISEEHNCSILLIHHTTKDQIDKAMTLDKLSGSSALSRDADFFIGINKLSNGVRYISFIENRYYPVDDKVIVFDIQPNTTIGFISEEFEGKLLKGIDKRFDKTSTDLILTYFKDNPIVIFETKQLIKQFDGFLSPRSVKNKLKELVNSNAIIKQAHGKYVLKD